MPLFSGARTALDLEALGAQRNKGTSSSSPCTSWTLEGGLQQAYASAVSIQGDEKSRGGENMIRVER